MNKTIYLTKRRIIIAAFMTVIAFLGTIKIGSGYLTPDEIYFLFGSDYEANKYMVTAKIMAFIYSIHPMLLIVINFILVVLVFKRRKSDGRIISIQRPAWLLLFPSVVFFCIVFLRDIYLFLAVTMIVYAPKHMNAGMKVRYFIIPLALLFVFKTELIIMVASAYLLSVPRIGKIAMAFTVGIIFPAMLAILFTNESIRSLVYLQAAHQEHVSFEGLLGIFFSYDFESWADFTIGSLINFPLFHLSYLLNTPCSSFDILMKTDSFVTLCLFVVAMFATNNQIRTDQAFRFCVWMLILSFAFSIIQTLPTSAIRYSLPFKPLIAYLASIGYIRFTAIIKNIVSDTHTPKVFYKKGYHRLN